MKFRLVAVMVLAMLLLSMATSWYAPTMALGPSPVTPTATLQVQVVNPSSADSGAMLTLTADGAVYAWPNTSTQFLGSLPNRSTVPTTARTPDSQWWRIPYPGGPDGNGWVAANVVMPNAAAANVPVVQVIFATATPVPITPTFTPAPCVYGSSYVADVTIPDGTQVGMGQSFNKVWRLRNSGTCPWGPGTTLAFAGGFQMGAPASVLVPQTAPGATADVGVTMVAPNAPGAYSGVWQMRDPLGQFFGGKYTVVINVPNPAPPPTPTPLPGPTINFWADTTSVYAGQCTNLHWDVNGVQAVYLSYDGHSQGVTGQGSQSVCPSGSGTTYTLQVIMKDGSQQAREIRINVINPQPPPTQAPAGVKINFTADSTLITIGTCTKLRWHVENWSQITLYLENSSQRVGGDGTQQVCPAYPTTYRLSVTDLSGGVHDRTVTINTKAPPPGLITPVPMPLTSQ